MVENIAERHHDTGCAQYSHTLDHSPFLDGVQIIPEQPDPFAASSVEYARVQFSQELRLGQSVLHISYQPNFCDLSMECSYHAL